MTTDDAHDECLPPNICTVTGPQANRVSFDHAYARLERLGWLVFPADVPRSGAGAEASRVLVRQDMIDVSTLLYVCDMPSPGSEQSYPHLDCNTLAEIRHAAKCRTDVIYQSHGAWAPRAPYDWSEVERTVSRGNPAHGEALMLREWAHLMRTEGRAA